MSDQGPRFSASEMPANAYGAYYGSPDGENIAASELKVQPPETQKDVMRCWFYDNFENPVENCPHDSGEGGYQYIYGGPYDAKQELAAEFEGLVDYRLIRELGEELSDISYTWSGNPSKEDLDSYLSKDYRHQDAFLDSVRDIEKLLKVKVESGVRQCWFRMLYVNVVTALETYLSDKFISQVVTDDGLLRKFVETNPSFRKAQFAMSKLFDIQDRVHHIVIDELRDNVMWHRLPSVQNMYRDTLGIHFPGSIVSLCKGVEIRHDCVHRNGKDREGEEIVLSEDDVRNLLKDATALVLGIEGMQPLDQKE